MLRVVEESPDDLDAYSQISIAFEVRSRFGVEPAGDQFSLVEEPVPEPWLKDETDPYRPSNLGRHLELTNIGVLGAYLDGVRVGGAIVGYDNPGWWFLDGRREVASCPDLRVDPAHRRLGAGRALFEAGATWARQRGCVMLLIETQDTNVPACRFYEAMGCTLHEVRPGFYPDSDELCLIWKKVLT